jgi:hypothetical protein
VPHPAKNKKRTSDRLYSYRLEGWPNAVVMHSGGQEKARLDIGVVDGAQVGLMPSPAQQSRVASPSLPFAVQHV